MRAPCIPNRNRLASNPDLTNDHTASCLRCQAEAVRYRTLRRHLREMQSDLVLAPLGLQSTLSLGLTGAEVPSKRTVGRERAVAAAGLMAMAGAVALFRYRAV